MILAHVAGVPVEELLPFALVSGAGLVAAARAWVASLIHRVRGSSAAPPRRSPSDG